MRPASPNVKKLSMKAGPASLPSATAEPMPPVMTATSRFAFCQGVIAVTSVSFGVGGGATTGGGTGRGAGGRRTPLCRTIEPRTTSSSRLTAKDPLPGPMESRNLVMLFE